MVFGSWRKVSAPWGSGPRGLPERSKWTREYCIVLFCFMQFAKWDPPVGGVEERGEMSHHVNDPFQLFVQLCTVR